MITFEYDGKIYSYIPFEQLDPDELPSPKFYKQSMYQDIGCGFDIETTKIPDEKLSFMYIWQFSLNDVTVIGRSWEEMRHFCEILQKRYNLNYNNKLLVYIHNESFEFQFMKKEIPWSTKRGYCDIFALDSRTVIKALSKYYIEFRDSMVLTQLSLQKLAENFQLSVQKLKGDLDYEAIRNSKTSMTNQELAYCINDVQILSEFYHKYIKKEFIAKQLKIPMTATGIPRDEMKRNFKKIPKKEKNKLTKRIKNAFPDFEMYKIFMEWLYRGGFTHSNVAMSNIVFALMYMFSFDFKSSYPAVMLHNIFPWKFYKEDEEIFYKYGFNKKFTEKYAYFGTFIFYNIRAKTSHSIETRNKIKRMDMEDALWDNGRLVSCPGRIEVVLNETDMRIYEMFYEWDKVEVSDFYISQKTELPKYLKDLVLKYFYLKETLPKNTVEYRNAKAQLNSLYGMCCTSLYFENYELRVGSDMLDRVESHKTYEELTQNVLLLPQWGIWITSYARYNLLSNIHKIGNDAVYSDTDSIKLINTTAHQWVFDTWNDKMRKINSTMYVGKYERETFKDLGIFDNEGKMLKFKCLGAKRYIYTITSEGHIKNKVTIAGLPKGSLEAKCEKEHLDIYEEFSDKMYIDSNESNKLTSAYCDIEFERDVTDYQGHYEHVKVSSCITLVPSHFEMNLTKDYLQMIEKFKQMNEKRLVKRRYNC